MNFRRAVRVCVGVLLLVCMMACTPGKSPPSRAKCTLEPLPSQGAPPAQAADPPTATASGVMPEA